MNFWDSEDKFTANFHNSSFINNTALVTNNNSLTTMPPYLNQLLTWFSFILNGILQHGSAVRARQKVTFYNCEFVANVGVTGLHLLT